MCVYVYIYYTYIIYYLIYKMHYSRFLSKSWGYISWFLRHGVNYLNAIFSVCIDLALSHWILFHFNNYYIDSLYVMNVFCKTNTCFLDESMFMVFSMNEVKYDQICFWVKKHIIWSYVWSEMCHCLLYAILFTVMKFFRFNIIFIGKL